MIIITNKWYMHDPESVLENETHKVFLDFDKQANQLISAREQALMIVNKKGREHVQYLVLLFRLTTEEN